LPSSAPTGFSGPATRQRRRPAGSRSAGRGGLALKPGEILAKQLVVRFELEAALEGGDRCGAIALQIGDVRAVLREQRITRRQRIGLVQQRECLVVCAAPGRALGLLGERPGSLLGRPERTARADGHAETLERRARRLVVRAIA